MRPFFDRRISIPLNRLGGYLLDAAVPRRCVFCGVPATPDEGTCCTGCREDLPWTGTACPRCALRVPSGTRAGAYCADCQAEPPPYGITIAPFEYAFPVDAAIKSMKFGRRLHYARALGDLLADAAGTLPAGADALLPVPLNRFRHLRRGFNQAVELARPVAISTGLPMIAPVCRVAATRYQSGLSAGERQRNLRGAFALRAPLAARNVVIVDDVVTTGATSAALARLLLEAGAESVSLLVLARA